MLTYNITILLFLIILELNVNKCNPSLSGAEKLFPNSSHTHDKTVLAKHNITKHNNISNPIIKERKLLSALAKNIESIQNINDDNFEVNYVEEYGDHDEGGFSRSYHNKGSKGYQDDEMFDKEDGADYLMKNGDDISLVKIDEKLINKDIGKKHRVHSQYIENLNENNLKKNDKQENGQKFNKLIEISLLKNRKGNVQNENLNHSKNFKSQNKRKENNFNRENTKNIPKLLNQNKPKTLKYNCPYATQQYIKNVGRKIKQPIIDTTNAETKIRPYKQNSNVEPLQADVSGGYETFIIHKRPNDNYDNNKKSYNKKNYKSKDNPDSIINYYPIKREEPKIKYKPKKYNKNLNKILNEKLNDDEKKENSQPNNENDIDSVDDDYSDYNDNYVEENNKGTIKNFNKTIEKNAEIIKNKRKSNNKHKKKVRAKENKSEPYIENNENQNHKLVSRRNKFESDYDNNNENGMRKTKKQKKIKNNIHRKIKHYKYNKQVNNKPHNAIKSRKNILSQELSDDNNSNKKSKTKTIPENKKITIMNNINTKRQSVKQNEKKTDKIFKSKSQNKLRETKLNPKQFSFKQQKPIRGKIPEEIKNCDKNKISKVINKVFKHRKLKKQKRLKNYPADYENTGIDSEENMNKNVKQNDYNDYYDAKLLNSRESDHMDKHSDKDKKLQVKIKFNGGNYDGNESDDLKSAIINQNSKEYSYDDEHEPLTKNNSLEDYYEEPLAKELDDHDFKENQNKRKMKDNVIYKLINDYIDDQEDEKPNPKLCANCDYTSSEYNEKESDNNIIYNDYQE